MSKDLIQTQDHGRVRVLRMNRPPSNSLNISLLAALGHAIDAAQSSGSVGAIVISSLLPKYFSSGMDLETMFSMPEDERENLFGTIVNVHRKIAATTKPTVAAMEGYALLGGYVLALGCDWRYLAKESGRIALSEIRLGISPTIPLIRIVCSMSGRPGLIKDLIVRGQTLRAEEAHEAGLVDHLLPKDGFLQSVIKETEKLTKLPPNAYASVKRDIRAIMLPNEEDLWQAGVHEFRRLFTSPEGREGMLAMKEKRKPRWE